MGMGSMRERRRPARYGSDLYVVALALVLLGAAGCGVRTSGRASAATATATPMPQLGLRAVTLPPGLTISSGSLGVSPVDGKVAWTCAAVGKGSFQIWATTDEGATWHAAGLLHPTTPEQPGSCSVLADQRDTKTAVFEVTWGAGEAGTLASMSYYSRDGGQHWQQLPDWTRVSAVETDGAQTYALITTITPPPMQHYATLLAGISPPRLSAPGPGPGPVYQGYSGFVVSGDGLQTWRKLHPGGSTPTVGVMHFWQGASNGDVFAGTYGGALWHSLDGGASWTRASTPVEQINVGMWLASRKAWMFCGQQGQPPVIMCSIDTGSTWRQVPTLTFTTHMQCDDWCHKKGGQDSQTIQLCTLDVIAADGSLLGACPYNVQFMEYRLALGAAQWTPLGEVTSPFCRVAANGIMWCANAQNGEWETATLSI